MKDERARARAWVAAVVLVAAAASPLQAQQRPAPLPQTRPERTDYRETSRYDDVMEMLRAVEAASPRIRLTTFGYSFEGRALPLVVVGKVADASPEAVRASGRTVVYVQGDIHAGEVEGKEATLLLLRDLAAGKHAEWLESMVLLVNPILNADGNEKVTLTNRPAQHGPIGGMGQRANAQNYDLNRDHTKLDAPETRSLALLLSRYDPHVALDLHTTDGTRHAYYMTYAPPYHPDTSTGIVDLLRKDLLPKVTQAVRAKYGWDIYYYGNLPWRGSTDPRGWYTYDHRARYDTNYVGLRNRVGILSETYSYLPFKDRIATSHAFVVETLEYIHRNGPAIRKVTAEADAEPVVGRDLTVRAAIEKTADSVDILMGDVVEDRNPYTGAVMLRRIDVVKPERMPEYGAFKATETAKAPRAYLVPATLAKVIDRLTAHGVTMIRLEQPVSLAVEQFRITASTTAERPYQGHSERTLTGAWEAAARTVPAGTVMVPMDQPLARLVFTLLEPRSDDSLVAWNLMDDVLEKTKEYPVQRTFDAIPGAR